jgi:hypothetical protein
MATVHEALEQFEAKACTARARYRKAVEEGTSLREARRAHDQARQQAFVDLVAQVKDRQAELGGLLDESTWTSLADANAAPDHRDELDDGHALTRDPGTRIRLGRLWDLGGEQSVSSSANAMNDLIRRG